MLPEQSGTVSSDRVPSTVRNPLNRRTCHQHRVWISWLSRYWDGVTSSRPADRGIWFRKGISGTRYRDLSYFYQWNLRELFPGEGFIKIDIRHLRLIEESIDLGEGEVYDEQCCDHWDEASQVGALWEVFGHFFEDIEFTKFLHLRAILLWISGLLF